MIDVDVFIRFGGSLDSLARRISNVLDVPFSSESGEYHILHDPVLVLERHGFVDDAQLQVESYPWHLWFANSIDSAGDGHELFIKLKALGLSMLLVRDVEEVLERYDPSLQ